MTITTTTDSADSGEVARLVGEERTVIIRRDTGEQTQRIDPRLIKAPSFDAIPRKTIDIDDTVTFHSPMTVATGIPDHAAAQPIAPLERVADETAVHTILDSLAGAHADLDGELQGPQQPVPAPKPPRPAAPGKRWYVGRHRAVREEHPYRGLVWFVLLAAVVTAFGMWQVR